MAIAIANLPEHFLPKEISQQTTIFWNSTELSKLVENAG